MLKEDVSTVNNNNEEDVNSRQLTCDSEELGSMIGEFGKWQCMTSILMALLKFPMAWFQLGNVLLAPPTQFRCAEKTLSSNPWTDNNTFLNACESFDPLSNSSVSCTAGYVYNRTVFRSTIITEWDLVCDREWLADMSQMVLMLGVLVGNVVFGITADRIGRKPTLLMAIGIQTLTGTAMSVAPWFWSFCLCRFLLGVANGGTMIASFVMCMEAVCSGGADSKYRTVVPILYQIPFGIGSAFMALLAYWLRDWRQLQLALSGLCLLYLLYYWGTTESPRWLLAVGRHSEACAVLEKAATMNGRDPAVVKRYFLRLSSFSNGVKKLHDNRNGRSDVKFGDLFRTRRLRNRTLLLYLNWLVSGITFFAFSLYLGHVGRNVFVTMSVAGLITVPGSLLCCLIVRSLGRRTTLAASNAFTAVCFVAIWCVPIGHYPGDWPRVLSASAGIVGLSISLPALYLYTGELFPTVIRNAGVGGAAMCSRAGSLLAPVLLAVGTTTPGTPLLILAAIAVGQTVLLLWLPETRGSPLPDTIEQAENIDSKKEKGRYTPVPVTIVDNN